MVKPQSIVSGRFYKTRFLCFDHVLAVFQISRSIYAKTPHPTANLYICPFLKERVFVDSKSNIVGCDFERVKNIVQRKDKILITIYISLYNDVSKMVLSQFLFKESLRSMTSLKCRKVLVLMHWFYFGKIFMFLCNTFVELNFNEFHHECDGFLRKEENIVEKAENVGC